jgi:hypothetical protein
MRGSYSRSKCSISYSEFTFYTENISLIFNKLQAWEAIHGRNLNFSQIIRNSMGE